MQLRWLGTAGFEFTSGDTAVLVDPYLTRNPEASPRQELKPGNFAHVQAILITHGHFDHTFDVPAIAEASGAKVYASPAVCRSLARRGVPWSNLRSTWQWGRAEWGPFRFKAVPACHASFDARLVISTLWRCRSILPRLARLGMSRYPKGEVFGWLIEAEGKKLFHLGSACMLWGLDEDIDVFMVPVQGRTDICEVAAGLVKKVAPGMVITHHHDDFYPPLSRDIDLVPFQEELARLGVEITVNVPTINHQVEV